MRQIATDGLTSGWLSSGFFSSFMMNIFARDDNLLNGNDIVLTNTPSPTPPQHNHGGTKMIGTIFLMVNATLGAGLLNFPQAFDNAGGIASATVVQLGFLVFITSALIVLAHCSDVTDTSSMQDTLAGLCGVKALFICGTCVAIYSFGCSLTFIIIIGDQFDRVMATFYGMEYCHIWYFSRPFITSILCGVFILPLCFFKRLEALSYASSVGCVTMLYLVWLVINEYLKSNDRTAVPTQMWPENATQALQIVPTICFAYQSHMTAIPTYACMKVRNIRSYTVCAVISMAICFLAYTTVGMYGYKTFGSGKVPEDILQGYGDTSVTLTVALIAVVIKNFTVYPIVLFCGRNAVLGLFGNAVADNAAIRISVTFLWFGLSTVIAICVPDIGPVINLLGTLSAAFIFVFPGICLLQCTLLKDPALHLNKDRFFVIAAILTTSIGAFVCGVAFVESLQDIAKQPGDLPLVTGFKSNLGQSLCP